MAELERKVYSSYAFKENGREKMRINREIYEELQKKWKISPEHLFTMQKQSKLKR